MATLKSRYKTAGVLYTAGGAIVALSYLKYENGQHVFMPKGRHNLEVLGGILLASGNIAHVTTNLRVAGRCVAWAYKKVFK